MGSRKDLDWREAVIADTPVINPDKTRYLRILWVNTHPVWRAINPIASLARAVILDDDVDNIALMVDNSIIGLS
jgi:hypothetical protein